MQLMHIAISTGFGKWRYSDNGTIENQKQALSGRGTNALFERACLRQLSVVEGSAVFKFAVNFVSERSK